MRLTLAVVGVLCLVLSVAVEGFAGPSQFSARQPLLAVDTDGDGTPDDIDTDDDNDGVPDGADSDSLDPSVCEDLDSDVCDDCSVGVDGFGPLPDNDPNNDGFDIDGDGLCAEGDPDDDNDGIPGHQRRLSCNAFKQ